MTMIRTAIITVATNLVSNIVEFQDAIPGQPLPGELWVASQAAQIGDAWNGTAIVPQPVPAPVATPAELSAYAADRQEEALAQVFSHALSDGSATLTTACDPQSLTGLNSLATWATTPALVAVTPTRVYYNSDWSAHTVTPAQMLELAGAVGAHVDSLYADLATVNAAIGAGTITTTAQVDSANWN